MMSVYAYTDAMQNFMSLLDEALSKGEVRIQRDDGKVFIIQPETSSVSPLDVEGINLGITTADIIECIHEGRRMS
ncbi:MAG: type II toxin-antitoxin system Phd/YefM family antitoxin [bacterium]|nr:type II toxin-antitoxin system Phd/YefM family antitoxin [bacterium]